MQIHDDSYTHTYLYKALLFSRSYFLLVICQIEKPIYFRSVVVQKETKKFLKKGTYQTKNKYIWDKINIFLKSHGSYKWN